MKTLMTMVATALTAAAFAQEPVAPAAKSNAPDVPAARAHRPRPERPMMGAGLGVDPVMHAVMNPKIAEKIGLSDEQKAKLKELRGQPAGNRELQAKVREGMERQAKLLQAEKIDEAAVMAAIDEVFESRKAIAKEQTKRVIAVKSILTPEQVKAAAEAMKEFRSSRSRRPTGPKPAPEAAPAEKPAK